MGKHLIRDIRRVIQHTVPATGAWPPFLRGFQPHHSSAPFISRPQMCPRCATAGFGHWLRAQAGPGESRKEGGWVVLCRPVRHNSPLLWPLTASRPGSASPQAGLCIFLWLLLSHPPPSIPSPGVPSPSCLLPKAALEASLLHFTPRWLRIPGPPCPRLHVSHPLRGTGWTQRGGGSVWNTGFVCCP